MVVQASDEGRSGVGGPPPTRPIFAIFEGGGAKGIGHVGALRAVEENGFEVIGVAGTSAGALVALLASIGLEANDIFHPDEPSVNLLRKFGKSPTGLLGEKEWREFQRLSRRWRWAAAKVFFVGPLVNAALSPRITSTVLRVGSRLGHFSTDGIRGFVNQVIRDRLDTIAAEAELDKPVPEQVTFRDLADEWPTVVPLKIVATDVDRGTLEIFDATQTPDVVVAEAVAASIAIPIVFRPAAIPSFRPGRFADGGLVSNLPIWVFAEEKLAYEREHPVEPPVPVIGFSLQEAEVLEEAASDQGLGAYLRKIVYASLQGSQGAAARFLDDVLVVPLTSSLGLLAFEEELDTYCAGYAEGRDCADRHLTFGLNVKPERIRGELERVRNDLLAELAATGRRAAKALRIALIRPSGAVSLRVMESVHMEKDADDRLLLDRRGGYSAQAFRECGLRIFRVQGSPAYMTKYERALVRPGLKTMLCVPIFRDSSAWTWPEAQRPEPAGILAIDSDEDLAAEFSDPKLLNMLVTQSAVLYAALSLEI